MKLGIEARVAAAAVLAVVGATARAARAEGASLYVLGDSITLGDSRHLRVELDAAGWSSVRIDAEPSRRIPTSVRAPYSGIKTVRALRASGIDPGAFVIALGTNDIGFVVDYGQSPRTLISDMLDAIGRSRRVLWVDVVRPDAPESAALFNRTLNELAVERPDQLVVLRWSQAAAGHPEWFLNDGIHLTEAGHAHRSSLVAQASVALREATSPPALPPVVATLYPGARGPRGWQAWRDARSAWAP
jgi:lysophospholipase L1-like esterase